MIEINDLPDEILEFIISLLPPYNDLEICKLVCKRWYSAAKNVFHHGRINLNKSLVDFKLCWKTIKYSEISPTIAGRFSHSAVVHSNSMYIFGGGSSTDTTFNDLWRFDLSNRQWVRPSSWGNYPSPKASASMVSYNNHLVLFGGWRYPSMYPPYQLWRLFDELHVYNIKESRWIAQTPLYGPPPMAGHSATIHKNKMIVFGGYQLHNDVNQSSNELWCLNLDNFTWSKPEVGIIKPPPRYGQFQFSLNENNILIVGGCGGPNNMFSDAWILNMTNDIWQWRSIPIKSKKWAATHMWCNPACKVENKLVVLGPTPSVPSDFQILRQQMPQSLNRIRRDISDDRNINLNRNLANDNNNINERRGSNGNRPPINNLNPSPNQQQREVINNIPGPQRNNSNDEAINRLQRNLALRSRENDSTLPKRFNEPFEDRFRMVAFSVEGSLQNLSRERQQERVRRMEEKMHSLRNSRPITKSKQEEPCKKRTKRNCLAMFVCDISKILAAEPYLEWIECKNYGIIAGAPERLILSSIVPGNNELIMFGGVHKESLSGTTTQVSNSIYFLTVPKKVI